MEELVTHMVVPGRCVFGLDARASKADLLVKRLTETPQAPVVEAVKEPVSHLRILEQTFI
jgi:hypothetical protein